MCHVAVTLMSCHGGLCSHLRVQVLMQTAVCKPKELFSAFVSVIVMAKKETARTLKDPDRHLGFGTGEFG